jgi:hypothetical protein
MGHGFAAKVLQPAKAGASVKPGASAPGVCDQDMQPVITGDSSLILSPFARIRGLSNSNHGLPGAHAPGFRLSPASQVKKRSDF